MSKNRLIANAVAIIMLCPGIALADPIPRQTPISGQVVSVKKGEDIVFSEETSKHDIFIKQDLKSGDVLKTNSEGALSIVFADQTQIRLARNTTLLVKDVTAGSPSEIELSSGSLWARTPRGRGKLTVRTPAATAAIRGTEWSLSVDGDQTRLQVASGSVQISNPQGQLNIEAGQAASATKGQAPVRVIIIDHGSREQMLYYLSPNFIPSDLSEENPLKPIYEAAYLGDLKHAEMLINQQLNHAGADADTYWLSAKIGFLTGNEDRIVESLEAGLTGFPNDAALLSLRAEYRATFQGRPDIALIDARRAVEINSNRASSHLILSKILLERGFDIEAKNAINRAISLSPNSAEFYVHRADIYLKQNRPLAAQAELDHAFDLSPDLSVARLGLGQIELLNGRTEEALDHVLAASADNPSYSLALLRLAEIYGRTGQPAVAKQQLDAADRLDPHTPFTPLYRTSLALHNYEGEDAIDGAQDALARFQARGGLYENLSENRETGSNISRAFRFMELEAWGRYYGDRTFDSFKATSYFDQVLNETPGPFFIRQEDTSFNPQNGDDLDQISSYLQGLTLDPLSVAQSEKDLQISKEAFLEGTLGGTLIRADTTELMRGEGSLQGRIYLQHQKGDMPVAFNVKARKSRVETDALDFFFLNAGVNQPDQILKNDLVEAYVGTELSPRDNLIFFGTYRTTDREITESLNLLLIPGDTVRVDREDLFGFGFWTHRLGDNNHITLGGGTGQFKNIIFDTTALPNLDRQVITRPNTTMFKYASAHYARRFSGLDVKIGGEGYWLDHVEDPQMQTIETTNGTQSPPIILAPQMDTESHDIRLYVDGRYKLTDDIILQGQISYLDEYTTANAFPVGNPRQRTGWNYHMGAAYEPVQGHWIRLAATETNQTNLPFTMSPINTLGLKAYLAPLLIMSEAESQIVRWDAQWTDRVFTSIEYQNQDMGLLFYSTPDGGQKFFVGGGKLDQVSINANYWLGGNWSINGAYTRANTQRLDNQAGRPLPFVPNTTGKISLVWTHPERISVKITGNYVGSQEDSILTPIKEHFTTDTFATWEPYDKQFEIRLGLLNMFNDANEATLGITAPGRTFFVSVKGRF